MGTRVLHPIRTVTYRTGLSPDLLRAWERRYHVVEPRRSPGGQRLYSDDDIEHLRQLHRAVLAGHPIGQVAQLDRQALATLVASEAPPPTAAPPDLPDESARAINRFREDCLATLATLDAPELERILRHAALQLSVPLLLDRLLTPLLREIGDRWEAGELRPIHEHLASVEIGRLLTWLVQTARVADDAPVLAVATPAGQQMELGALMVAASAAAEGWRVAWLGPDLPSRDIVLGAEALRPRALAISLAHQTRDPELHRELERVARGVAGKTTLLVGGRAAPPHALMLERLGAVVMGDLESLRDWLRRHDDRRRPANR
jgi:DNA-binding transcriptional MerR regulator